MTSLRLFKANDLLKFNDINLDPLTETYSISFYLMYLARWPDYFYLAVNHDESLIGYVMGKAEGICENWHGHVTALTVANDYRRMGLANYLMNILEEVSEEMYNGYFVDLFVRKSNAVAIRMYEKFGYSVYRTVLDYYTGLDGDEDEDAYDMRKALKRDVLKKSIIPLDRPVRADEVD